MKTVTRVGLAIGAIVLGAGLAGQIAKAQDPDTNSRPGPAFGGPGGPGRFGGPGGPAGLMELRRLNLTDAQRDQVRGIMDSHQDQQRAVGERTMAAREALNTAITSPTFDESAVLVASAALADAEADGALLRARVHAEISQMLTSEQQAQLADMQSRRQARAQNRRERFQQRDKR